MYTTVDYKNVCVLIKYQQYFVYKTQSSDVSNFIYTSRINKIRIKHVLKKRFKILNKNLI